MNNQNRYYILLFIILGIGLISYITLVPNFSRTEFNTEVIENIEQGITTTSEPTNNQESTTNTTQLNEEQTNQNINEEDEEIITPYLINTVAKKNIDNYKTYLIIGSDERSDEVSETRGNVEGQRADVIILALIDEEKNSQVLLSIPRDLIVKNLCTEKIERINATYTKNNCGNKAENLAANINVLTGLKIDHFVSFDFEGFEKIIDSFNGVEICVDETQREGFSFELQKGCQVVEGLVALNWVVSRHTEVLVGEKIIDENGNDISTWEKLPGVSDLSRNERQKYIIAIEDAFVIDENLTLNNAINLVWSVRSIEIDNIKELTLPVDNLTLSDGRQVLTLNKNFSEFAELNGLITP
ncbi:MAG: hypothetical protein EBW04_05760 [Betaproteobacteria bacterium]|nr:hypothetical protein [Betaproteobacteria bacterium]